MNQDSNTIIVRRDLRPAYYDQFHCIMSECRLSCCEYNWIIAFDKKEYLRLKNLRTSAELGKLLQKTVHRFRNKTGETGIEGLYGQFIMENGACPMLRDGLCALQLEKGADVLPTVCQVFPRQEEYILSGYLERSLSLGCEAVIALLWDLEDGVTFLSDPLKDNEMKMLPKKEQGAFNPFFQEIRSLCIDILQDRQMILPARILLMGMRLKELVDCPDQTKEWLSKTAAVLEDPARIELCGGLLHSDQSQFRLRLAGNLRALMKFPANHDAQCNAVREQIISMLSANGDIHHITLSEEGYLHCAERLKFVLQGHEFFFENLMVSMFFGLQLPSPTSEEELWKSYVNFCSIYSFFRFMAVLSCHDESMDEAAAKAELFRFLTVAGRMILHNKGYRTGLRDELFQNDSATLAHMAILLAD